MTLRLSRRSRRLHRQLVPIAALPLALTASSGALYETALSFDLDAPWLLRLHTGHFGVINLQPWYAAVMGVLTLILIASGVRLLVQTGPRDQQPPLTPEP